MFRIHRRKSNRSARTFAHCARRGAAGRGQAQDGLSDDGLEAVARRWLAETRAAEPGAREAALAGRQDAPEARFAHPREEHLTPLLVAAGAAPGEPSRRVVTDEVVGVVVSALEFGSPTLPA